MALILGGQSTVRLFITEQCVQDQVQGTAHLGGLPHTAQACGLPGSRSSKGFASSKLEVAAALCAYLYFWQQQLGDYQDNAAAQVLISAWIHTT